MCIIDGSVSQYWNGGRWYDHARKLSPGRLDVYGFGFHKTTRPAAAMRQSLRNVMEGSANPWLPGNPGYTEGALLWSRGMYPSTEKKPPNLYKSNHQNRGFRWLKQWIWCSAGIEIYCQSFSEYMPTEVGTRIICFGDFDDRIKTPHVQLPIKWISFELGWTNDFSEGTKFSDKRIVPGLLFVNCTSTLGSTLHQ